MHCTHLVVGEAHGELDWDDLDDVLDGVEPRQHGRRVGHHHHPVSVLVVTEAQSDKIICWVRSRLLNIETRLCHQAKKVKQNLNLAIFGQSSLPSKYSVHTARFKYPSEKLLKYV